MLEIFLALLHLRQATDFPVVLLKSVQTGFFVGLPRLLIFMEDFGLLKTVGVHKFSLRTLAFSDSTLICKRESSCVAIESFYAVPGGLIVFCNWRSNGPGKP